MCGTQVVQGGASALELLEGQIERKVREIFAILVQENVDAVVPKPNVQPMLLSLLEGSLIDAAN